MAITTLGLTGFEHGFIGAGAQNGGGLFDAAPGPGWSVSTSSPRNGSYCAHCIAPLNTESRLLNNIIGGPTKIVVRFAVKVTSRPSSGTAQIMGTTVGVGQSLMVFVSSTGVVSLQYRNGELVFGPTIDTTNWHLIEFSSTQLPILRIGKSMVSRKRGPRPAAPAWQTTVFFGPYATGPAYIADYDDLIVGTWTNAATDWYGDGKVLAQLAGCGRHSCDYHEPLTGRRGDRLFRHTHDRQHDGRRPARYRRLDRDSQHHRQHRAPHGDRRRLRGDQACRRRRRQAMANAVKALISYSSSTTTPTSRPAMCATRRARLPSFGA